MLTDQLRCLPLIAVVESFDYRQFPDRPETLRLNPVYPENSQSLKSCAILTTYSRCLSLIVVVESADFW